MKITLTGASGLIGTRLVAALLAENHQLHLLSRRKPSNLPTAVSFSAWDANSGEDPPAAAFEGANAVIHLAGEPVAQRWTETAKERIRVSRVGGTEALLRTLRRLPQRPERMLAASAIGYYGDRGDEILTEMSKPGTGFLPETCVAWEGACEKARLLGMRVVRLRFGIVLGREGGALAKMLTPFKLGVGGKIGSGKQWMSWIHVDDVVGLLLFALKDREEHTVFNVTAPKPVRNAEFTAALGSALHRPAFLPIPPFVLKLAFGEMSRILLESQRVEPTVAQRAGYDFRFVDLASALKDLLGS